MQEELFHPNNFFKLFRNKFFYNTSWLFLEKFLRICTGLLVGVWIARYLGPNDFGILNYAISFVGIFSAIATLGVDNVVVRELVINDSKRDELLGTAFVLKFIGAITVLVLLAIILNLMQGSFLSNLLILIIASASIFQSFNVIEVYFQSKVLSKYVVFVNIVSLLISSCIKILLIINNASLICFAMMVVFESAVLSLGYIYIYKKQKITFQTWRFNKTKAILLLADSWPLVLSGIAVSIYMKIDQIMLMKILGSNAVGQYSAGIALSETWYFVPVIITNSLFPAIVEAKKKSEKLFIERLKKLYALMIWLAVLIAIPTALLSDWLINLLYGNQYNQAGKVLLIHIWAGIFVFLGVASNKYLIANNYTKISFFRTIIGAIANILLNLFLLKKYGIRGAAFATVVSYFIATFSVVFFKKSYKQSIIMLKSFLPYFNK